MPEEQVAIPAPAPAPTLAPQTMQSPSLEEVIAEAPAVEPLPDAPAEAPLASEPGPITAESVASDKAPAESLPDSSLIAGRLNARGDRDTAIDQRREQEVEYKALQEELRVLRTLHSGSAEYQQKYNETRDRVDASDDDQSQLLKEMREELNKMRSGQQTLKDEIAERERQTELTSAQSEVVSWVKEQEVHFPLINAIGQQGLVFQKMLSERARTGTIMGEAQAGREVEAEIVAIVERCAPQLGYTKSQAAPGREEQVSVGSGPHTSSPIDLNSMNDDDALNALVSDYERKQR